MARLEKGVQGLCGNLARDIKPGTVFVTWYDNPRPNLSTPLEEHIVSMLERGLIQRGFSVSATEKDASYKLMLTMIPSRKSTLVLASVWQGDGIIATRETHLIDGPEKWNRVLCSYPLRTKTTIHVGSTP